MEFALYKLIIIIIIIINFSVMSQTDFSKQKPPTVSPVKLGLSAKLGQVMADTGTPRN